MAKYYESTTVFNFSWEQVAQGFWKRYPNPHRYCVISFVFFVFLSEFIIINDYEIFSDEFSIGIIIEIYKNRTIDTREIFLIHFANITDQKIFDFIYLGYQTMRLFSHYRVLSVSVTLKYFGVDD